MSSSQQSANETAATGMTVVEPGQGTQMGPEARMLELTSSAAPFQELAPAATGAQAPAEPLGDA
jgi:hypothetical protein